MHGESFRSSEAAVYWLIVAAEPSRSLSLRIHTSRSAIIRTPQLLLLDEATSALDSVSERIVSETIERLIERDANGRAHRTTVLIAHRLSTVKRADKIVVIDGGRVVEEGSHDALLMLTDGVYRRLALAQDPTCVDNLVHGNASRRGVMHD